MREPTKRAAGFIATMDCLSVPKLPAGPEWTYEIKLDGYRLDVVRSGCKTMLYSRRQNTRTEGIMSDIDVTVKEQREPLFTWELLERYEARTMDLFPIEVLPVLERIYGKLEAEQISQDVASRRLLSLFRARSRAVAALGKSPQAQKRTASCGPFRFVSQTPPAAQTAHLVLDLSKS